MAVQKSRKGIMRKKNKLSYNGKNFKFIKQYNVSKNSNYLLKNSINFKSNTLFF